MLEEAVVCDEAGARVPQYAVRLLVAGITLLLLYAGRTVLIPVVLALMLSLLLAPLVGVLRHMGIPRVGAVLVTVAALAIGCAAITGGLGVQILRIGKSIPLYEATVQRKLQVMDEIAITPLRAITREASRLAPEAGRASASNNGTDIPSNSSPPVARESHKISSLLVLRKLLGSLWVPLQTTGIVLLVLIFVLLDHESLRDRFIRIADATDISAATLALSDASERLSRYFASQFMVNFAFGVTVSMILWLIHFPQAMLCGALVAVLRFIPYVGVSLAALMATALAFAVDPGWWLSAATLATFIGLDILVGQLLEPHLYGHATGLSPLSVVMAAIFWSALWGPVGLLLSTPLSLCLLVAGRHLKGLGFLEMLLGTAPPLTLPQSFYQRALSGDPNEILATARKFLKHKSLSTYGDRVLLPALHLARLDADRGATTRDQQLRIRRVIVDVVDALSRDGLPSSRQRAASSVLEQLNAGQWLRRQREKLSGRWQGPLGVPPGSLVICSGLGAAADDLAAELLVRLLRSENVDARHFSPKDVDAGLPPGADPEGVSIVFLVSAFPNEERGNAELIASQVLTLLPQAQLMTVFCPGISSPRSSVFSAAAPPTAGSLAEAMQICAEWKQTRARERMTIQALEDPAEPDMNRSSDSTPPSRVTCELH